MLIVTTTNSFAQDFGCYSASSTSGSVIDGAYMRESIIETSILLSDYWDSLSIKPDSTGYYTKYYYTLNPDAKIIKMQGNLANGTSEGLWKFYILEENTFVSGNFINGNKDGTWIAFRISEKGDTILSESANYINDTLNGEMRSFVKSGKTYKIINYKDGLKHGKLIRYYYTEANEPDIIYSIDNYFQGKLDGDCIRLDENNQMDTTHLVHFKDGIRNGKSFDKYWNGEQITENYKNGKLNGLSSLKESDGSTIIINYSDGQITDKLQKYHHNGTLMLEIEFKNNLPYNVTANNDSLGVPYDTCKYINGTGILTTYYKDGNMESSYTYQGQTPLGSFIEFNNDGSVIEKGDFLSSTLFSMPNFSIYSFTSNINQNISREFSDNQLDNYVFNDPYNRDIYIGKRKFIDSLNTYAFIQQTFDSIGNYYRKYIIISNNGKRIEYSFYDTIHIESIVKQENVKTNTNSVVLKNNGMCYYYYLNGTTKAEINFENGKEKSGSKYYDDSGKLIRTFIEDQSGSYSIYKGDTVNRIDRNGLKQGKWIEIYQYGYNSDICHDIPNSIKYYKDDKPTGVWEFYSIYSMNNDLQSTQEWISETLAYEKNYWNNKLISEGYINDKKKDGLWKFYDFKKHFLSAEGMYFLDYKHGEWKTFNRRGKIQSTQNYYLDQLTSTSDESKHK
jgi:antitoxin component YwqK of YwqJK toxin-antitoxin module